MCTNLAKFYFPPYFALHLFPYLPLTFTQPPRTSRTIQTRKNRIPIPLLQVTEKRSITATIRYFPRTTLPTQTEKDYPIPIVVIQNMSPLNLADLSIQRFQAREGSLSTTHLKDDRSTRKITRKRETDLSILITQNLVEKRSKISGAT